DNDFCDYLFHKGLIFISKYYYSCRVIFAILVCQITNTLLETKKSYN
ncbi:MAG: hypothetical protein ACI81A_002256, partial [Paraglaciecola sp.]